MNNGYIIFNKKDLNKLLDLIGDYLIKYGFDKKDNLTDLGIEIEKLQDKFLSFID